MNKRKHMKPSDLRQKSLVMAVSGIMTWLGCIPVQTAFASDMEIYQNPDVQGKTIIMLMLDTSQSMRTNSDAGPNSNEIRSAVMERAIHRILNGGLDDNGNTVTALTDDVIVGLSMFDDTTGTRGMVVIPARPLSSIVATSENPYGTANQTQRALLTQAARGYGTYYTSSGTEWLPSASSGTARSYSTTKRSGAVSNINPVYDTGTPSISLYAETVAYLLGTTTKGTGSDGKLASTLGTSVTSTAASSKSENSGFTVSQSPTKNSSYYKPPLTAQISDDDTRQCSAQGIFFFTDGTPTVLSPAQSLPLLKNALSQTGYDNTLTCDSAYLSPVYYKNTYSWGADTPFSSSAQSGYSDRSSLSCIGNLAYRLVNKTALTATPLNKRIYTSIVAFGKDWSDNSNNWLVSKEIRKWGYIGMKGGLTDYDNPASVSGLTTTSGFTVANDSAGVATAMSNFVAQLKTSSFDAASFGTYVVPKDPFNTDNAYSYTTSAGSTIYPVYAPQFQPNISAGSSVKQLWLGNLKKYKIVAGIIKDSSGTTLLDSNGAVASNTTDFWNAGTSTDGSSALLGGALSQLVTPSYASSTYTVRPLWTDATISSTTLNSDSSLLKMTPDKVAGLTLTSTSDANYTSGTTSTYWRANTWQPYLLSALGYKLSNTTLTGYGTAKTWSASDIQSLSSMQQMGSVVHSDPIMLSMSGTYNSSTDTYTDRTDYVIYGSMQGMLHMVNQSTGKEVFTFLPHEILKDSTTIDGSTTTTTGGRRDALLYQDNTVRTTTLPYFGIDAPWNVWTEYSTSTGNVFTATKANIYGGMRMGGYSYYGLNVLSPTNPKFLFQIDPINGSIKSSSSITMTSAKVAALQAMGQSWSKPTIAKIRYGNTIRTVMIVGGGYDTAYEDTGYQPATDLGGTTTTTTTMTGPVEETSSTTNTVNSSTETDTDKVDATATQYNNKTGAGTTTVYGTATTTSSSNSSTTTSVSGDTTTTVVTMVITETTTTPVTKTTVSYSYERSWLDIFGWFTSYYKTTTTSTYNIITTTTTTITSTSTSTTTTTSTSSSSNKGAGVYIFDATTGELIWDARFGSSSSTSATETKNPDMKYSVVSQIKTADRNNDGLVDHLYFGDLGGQVWRVDLNNTYGTATTSFASLTRLADFSSKQQRFYEMPTFTIHKDANGRFAAIALASGNRSRPLDETNTYNNRLYVLHDHDVTSSTLFSDSTRTLKDKTESDLTAFASLGSTATAAFTAKTKAGWYYEITNTGSTTYTKGTVKALGGYTALASGGNYSDLYVSLYNPEDESSNQPTTCTGGITGVTTSAQFCLPYGVCSGNSSASVTFTKMGDGIQKLNAATYTDSSGNTVTGILNVSGATNKSSSTNSTYSSIKQFKPVRWFNQLSQ